MQWPPLQINIARSLGQWHSSSNFACIVQHVMLHVMWHQDAFRELTQMRQTAVEPEFCVQIATMLPSFGPHFAYLALLLHMW